MGRPRAVTRAERRGNDAHRFGIKWFYWLGRKFEKFEENFKRIHTGELQFTLVEVFFNKALNPLNAFQGGGKKGSTDLKKHDGDDEREHVRSGEDINSIYR